MLDYADFRFSSQIHDPTDRFESCKLICNVCIPSMYVILNSNLINCVGLYIDNKNKPDLFLANANLFVLNGLLTKYI